jgi:hypothetical protein
VGGFIDIATTLAVEQITYPVCKGIAQRGKTQN